MSTKHTTYESTIVAAIYTAFVSTNDTAICPPLKSTLITAFIATLFSTNFTAINSANYRSV